MAATTKRVFSGEGIACARGGRMLFQNLSFGLGPGDVLHLSGPNGAGKTSLLRLLAGALPLAAGTVLWEGRDFLEKGFSVHAARHSFLPAADGNLKAAETAGETLAFWAAAWGVAADIPAALARLGLSDLPVRRLSAGQRRRLSLARAFLKPAPLWLLDEPLNGLDAGAAALFVTALDAHCAGGGMAVVASHLPVSAPQGGVLQRLEMGAAA